MRRLASCSLRCRACGATGEGKGQSDTQGDGVMTGEIFIVEEMPEEWDGGDPKCPHDKFEITDTESPYGEME
jgi:hypothetical protein